jgi:GNAT superfamily N-acetyltransferase
MANTDAPEIRPIDASECEAVWLLSVEAGWNQSVADWRFMLGAGRGFGCAAPDGTWQASSLILPLGTDLAWISMVLVTRSAQRRGLGTGLLKRCIEEVRSAGAVAGLDATEQGRPIYLPLGFRDLYPISRWHFDRVKQTSANVPSDVTLRPLEATDLPDIARYDHRLTGMERAAVLAHLAMRQPALAWIAVDPTNKIAGFVLGRDGRLAISLGPVVADREAIAVALIARAAAAGRGPFIIDVPQAHRVVRKWLEREGAMTLRGYVRMTLGRAERLDDPSNLFALAGPELG